MRYTLERKIIPVSSGTEARPSIPSHDGSGEPPLPVIVPRTVAFVLFFFATAGLTGGCIAPLKRLQRDSTQQRPSETTPVEDSGTYRAYLAYLKALDAERIGDYDAAETHLRRALDYDPTSPTLWSWLGKVHAQKRQLPEALEATRHALELDPDHLQATLQYATFLRFDNQVGEAEKVYLRATEIAQRNPEAYLQLGNLYRALGRANRGLRVVDRYESVGGEPNVRMQLLRAALLKDLDRTEEAETVLLDLLDIHSDSRQIQKALLQLYMTNNDLAATAKHLETVLIDHPWHSWIPETLVQIYARLGDVDALNRHLKTASQTNPALGEELRLEVVEELSTRRQFDQAMAILEPVLASMEPTRARAHFYAGFLYTQMNDYDQALEMYREVGESSDYHARAIEQRALVRQQQGDHAGAEKLLLDYLAREPEDDTLRYTLVGLYKDAKRPEKALEVIEALLEHNPEDVEAVTQKAYVLNDMDQQEEATRLLHERIAAQPRAIRLYDALAQILSDQGQVEAAVAILKDALRVRPDAINIRFSLGMYYDRLKKHDDAVAQMEKILEMDESNADAMNFIGYTWAELGIKLPEAELLIKRALELDPNNGYITDSLGWVYYKNARFDEAVKFLERAVELTTREPIIVEHLADAYLKAQRTQKALEMYERASREAQDDQNATPADRARIRDKLQSLNAGRTQGIPKVKGQQ